MYNIVVASARHRLSLRPRGQVSFDSLSMKFVKSSFQTFHSTEGEEIPGPLLDEWKYNPYDRQKHNADSLA